MASEKMTPTWTSSSPRGVLASLILLLSATAYAAPPSVYFPINAQLPPVARLNEPFSFTPSPHTFSSTSPDSLAFSLADPAPKWLSIDPKTARLSGTPQEADLVDETDVVGVPLRIVAEDDEGSTAMDATLVVSRSKAPTVQVPISEQIARFGDFSVPATLLSYPSTQFSYTFSPNTFSHTGPINYYASSDDGSPLPPWVIFDVQRLVFSGTTPPSQSLTQPPKVYDFQIVASDVVGFSAARVSFSIAIGEHKLSTTHEVVSLKATRGKELRFNGLAGTLKLDGKNIKQGGIIVDAGEAPSWLYVDSDSFAIKGTPPQSATSANFTLKFQDRFSDSLGVTVLIDIQTDIFRTALSAITVSGGDKLDVDLKPYFLDPNGVTVKVKTDPSSDDWLSVTNMRLVGTVPEESSTFKVSLVATLDKTGKDEVQEFSLDIAEAPVIGKPTESNPRPTSATPKKPVGSNTPHNPNSTKSSGGSTSSNDPDGNASTTSGISPSETATGARSDGDHVLSAGSVAAIVIVPIAAVAILLGFLVCRHRRRQRRRAWENRVLEISRPITRTLTMNGFSDSSRLPSALDISNSFGFGPSGTRIGFIGPASSPPSLPEYNPGQKGFGIGVKRSNRNSRIVTSFVSDMPPEYLSPDINALKRATPGGAADDTLPSRNRRSWVTVHDLPTPEGGKVAGLRNQDTESQSHMDSIDFFSSGLLSNPSKGGFFAVPSIDSGSVAPNGNPSKSSMQQQEQTLLEAISQTEAGLSSRNLLARSAHASEGSTGNLSVVSSASALPAPLDPPRPRPRSTIAPLLSNSSIPSRRSIHVDALTAPAPTARAMPNPNRASTPVRPTSYSYSQNDASHRYDVSPTANSNSLHYVKRPKQAHLPYQPPTSRQQNRHAHTRSSTSNLSGAPLSSMQAKLHSRAPSISVHSDRDLSMYRSRLTSDSTNTDFLGKENWTNRDSLGIAYGESYSKLIEDVPCHPSRGTLPAQSTPGSGGVALRERQPPQQQQLGAHGRATSVVLKRESTSDANMIGRAVSRYSKPSPVAWDHGHLNNNNNGGTGLGNKENSGLTVKSARTGDSGIMAFV